MKRTALVITLLSCARHDVAPQPPRGLQLENVQLTTWRGADVSARGTARKATLTGESFTAESVELVTAAGTSLKTAQVDGELDLDPVVCRGLLAKTAEGCEASTATRVVYQGGVATSDGAVAARGCGFTGSGAKLTYWAHERRAEVEGPVRTRVEAAP